MFDGLRVGLAADRSQSYKDSQGVLDQFWLWSMQAGTPSRIRRSTCRPWVMHGEDDQIVTVHDSALKSAWLTTGAKEIYYTDVRTA